MAILNVILLINQISKIESYRWSYGVLLYEIFSLGETPYASVQQNEMIEYLDSGNRLPQPALADNAM